ncbi:MAG: VanZ family protein [Mycobacteriaceae bacterium]|nr:VanZ family protein [Mycobacteriaceae bacterium]
MRALPFVAVVLVSLPILFAPASDVPTAPPGADKLVHLALFAALAITGSLARIPRTPLAATLAAYALGSEILQAALPLHRSFSLADVAADLSGLAFGLLLCRF